MWFLWNINHKNHSIEVPNWKNKLNFSLQIAKIEGSLNIALETVLLMDQLLKHQFFGKLLSSFSYA